MIFTGPCKIEFGTHNSYTTKHWITS